MLTLLHLKDFVIVEELTVEATSGLTCLTGETGAGKSILIDALELVLGARSDVALIREGAQKTEVSAEFTVDEATQAWLREAQIDALDTVLLRRTVDTNGRSRCWINGVVVTVAQMHALGELLLDIHGQHAHQSLLKTAFQLRLVDGFAKDDELLNAVRSDYKIWQEAKRRLAKAIDDKEKVAAETDRLNWTLELLNDLSPKEGEYEEISTEHARLSNTADIEETVQSALDNLSNGEANVADLLKRAQSELNRAGQFDATFTELASALSEASSIVDDVVREAGHGLSRCNPDQETLETLDERLNAYWRLAKKFNRAPEELYLFYEETKKRLHDIEVASDLEALEKEVKNAEASYKTKATCLTKVREVAAKKLSYAVTAQMQLLAMQGGKLEIVLCPADPWSDGLERCEFLVAGHAGATARALTKVASGGELARISLAIAVITATLTPVGTLIFDEVDSGIGGAVAEVVGLLLRRLGKSRQVLCVTHLPQVASSANHQWQVTKTTENDVTRSTLKVLNDVERIEEIARMLGGIEITDVTRKAAYEMLTHASKVEANR